MGDAALVLCPTEGVLHPPALPGACVSPGLRPHKLTGVSGSRGWRQLPMGCVDQVSEMGRRNPLTANTRGFLLLPMGVLLEETSVIHPPVTLSNNPFTSPKNPWHQWVLSHQPHNHQVPRSHHSQLTWLSNPALDTHQSHDDYVLCYRYISPQNMNMLKHPIMFWHACKEKKKRKKKPMATKTTACQWQLLHAHTKLNYILLKRDIIMAFVSPHPSPSPIPHKIKGEISTHIRHEERWIKK